MTVLLDAIYSLCSLMGWNYCYRSCRKYELSKLTQSVTYPKIIIIIALSIQRIWTLFIIVYKNVVKWEFCGFKLYETMSCLVLLRDVIITRWRLEIWLNIVCYIQKHLSSHWYKLEKFVFTTLRQEECHSTNLEWNQKECPFWYRAPGLHQLEMVVTTRLLGRHQEGQQNWSLVVVAMTKYTKLSMVDIKRSSLQIPTNWAYRLCPPIHRQYHQYH